MKIASLAHFQSTMQIVISTNSHAACTRLCIQSAMLIGEHYAVSLLMQLSRSVRRGTGRYRLAISHDVNSSGLGRAKNGRFYAGSQ